MTIELAALEGKGGVFAAAAASAFASESRESPLQAARAMAKSARAAICDFLGTTAARRGSIATCWQ